MTTDAYPWSAGFRSLEEQHDYRLDEVDGQVPTWLRGTLFHNGSGRNELAGNWFPHWFDGDGMITAVRFDEQGIHFRNRYVATDNYRDETQAQRILYRGFGKMRPGGVLANAFRLPGNVSNTSVLMDGDRLLTLWEGGPPYALDPGTLATHGLEDFGGKVKAFSAHPKRDPDTGEVFNFGVDYGAKCTLTPYRLAQGTLTALPKITLPYAVMNHDFVLTQNHLVFCIGPILSTPLAFLLGFKSFDGALHWEGGKPTLILLVPRGGGQPRIIETDAFFQFHFANGYEENGAVVLDLMRYPDYLTIGEVLRNYWKSEWPARGMAALTRLTVDLASGKVQSRTWNDGRGNDGKGDTGQANEFPFINPARVSKKHRYAYFLCNPADRPRGLQQQLARIDFETGTVMRHDFGPDGYPGEPCFISSPGGGEDDGVVVTQVFDAKHKRTDVVGLDARDVSAKPLFVGRLKHHVPFCLHGTFTPRRFD
jgi:all-trans-8'-apo-beta-carotenal 15,15'-oxygenase